MTLMLAWESFSFAGIIPRLRKKQLPKGYANVAHDVDLTHGTLKSFLEPRFVKQAGANDTHLHMWGRDIFIWERCVSVAEWIPDCPRLFVTGRTDHPEVAVVGKDGRLVYRRLGVPAPVGAPHAIASAGRPNWTDPSQANGISSNPGELKRSVAYLATFVNAFGEEGGPSMPSNDVEIEDGQRVDIEFRYDPPFDYDVKKIRLYRRETGFRTGMEKEQDPDTYWFFLEELPIGAISYVDTKSMVDLGWVFEGLNTREPPAGLSNITDIPETAILAGSVGNKLLFSKNLQANNWPLGQEMTLDDNIVALGAVGDSLYVATDGHPYRIKADVGCDDVACREAHKYPQAFPMINCHYGHGAISTPFGFIYAAPDGLVLLSGDANPKVITTDVLSQDDWRMLEPQTARLAYYKGALFVVTNKISFILWMDAGTYTDAAQKKMTTISDAPRDMFVNRQGELLMLNPDGKITQWNAGNKLRPYKWVSATIDTGFAFDLTRLRALVRSGFSEISIVSDRAKVSRRFPTGDTVIPYSRHGRVREFEIEAEGEGEVTEIVAGVCGIDMGEKG